MLMERRQSEKFGTTSNPDEIDECLSEPENTSKNEELSPYPTKSYKTDRRRTKSLPVNQDHNASLKESSSVRGKRVQFADMMGLNLANVRHFDTDEICNASPGLQSDPPNQELLHSSGLTSPCNLAYLVPAFYIPVASVDFDLMSRRLGVALESVTTGSEVKGVIRVMCSNEKKAVGVRYTFNNWHTFSDIEAVPRPDEEKMLQYQQFDFTLHMPLCFDKDSSVHFAVYCRTDHEEYWDNNDGKNYSLKIQIPVI